MGTIFDPITPQALEALPTAERDIETTTGELIGLGFDKEALDRNYWGQRKTRVGRRQITIAGDISEALYGDRNAWSTRNLPDDEGPGSMGQMERLIADLEQVRAFEPGRLANFPGTLTDLQSSAEEQVRREMQEERDEVDARIDNRSRQTLLGGVAEFVGMAGAAVTDIEGLATLPLGAGTGSLARTVAIEALIGAGSEAVTIPAYNAQADFLGRERPDPLTMLLFGATFGAGIPLAGRGLRDGAALTQKGVSVTNAKLIEATRRLRGSDQARGAASALAREEAVIDTTPAGASYADHAARIDATEEALEAGDPLGPPPADTVRAEGDRPISDRLMDDLQAELGLTREQAAGIVGNLAHESNGFRNLQEIAPMVPGSRGGFGYAQWTADRRRAFEAWADERGLDVRSYEANRGFLIHELTETNEAAVMDALRGAGSAAEAAQIFSERFLRPGIPHMDSRLAWTERALGGDIGEVQGPLRSRTTVVVRDFGDLQVKASDEGFEIRMGEFSFAQPWAGRGGDAVTDASSAETRIADLRRSRDDAQAMREDLVRAANVDRVRTEERIEAAIAQMRDELKATQGKTAKAKVRARIREAEADLEELKREPEIIETPESQVLRAQAEGFAQEIADLQRDFPQLRDVPASREAIPAEGAPANAAPEGTAPAETGAAAAGAGPTSQRTEAEALPPVDVAVRTNQPPSGGIDVDPVLFDDPVMSPGAVAQAETGIAELRAWIAANPDNDLMMPVDGDGAATVPLSQLLDEIDEQAEFVETLNLCMPKGVSNG